MNMISTGAFQNEMDASNKQLTLAEKFAAVWEKKNAKAARAGGVSLMALSLAACGSSSTTTSTTTTDTTTTTTDTTTVTPVVPAVNTISYDLLELTSTSTVTGTSGADVFNVQINAAVAKTVTISGIETINLTAYGNQTVDFTKITDVETFTAKDSTGTLTLNNVNDATMAIGFNGSGTNNVTVNYKAGALSGSSDTVTLKLDGAAAVAVDVDAGFEAVSIDTGSAAAGQQAAGVKSTLTTLTAPGVTTATVTGANQLVLNNDLSGYTTVTATGASGGIVGKTIGATSNLSTEGFVGAAGGSTLQMGAGVDKIAFNGSDTANKTNTIKMGAGDDTLNFTNDGAGASYVFGEAGADKIYMTQLNADDLVDGGAGTDTLELATATSHTAVLRGIENVTLNGEQNFTVNSADSALAITVASDGADDDVLLNTLPAGSTVKVTDGTTDTSGTIDKLTVGFKATEASTSIDVDVVVGAGTAGDDTVVSKATAVTIDYAKAVTLHGSADVEVDDSTSLTITGAKAMDFGAGIADATTDALKTVSVTGTLGVDLGASILNSDKLETATISAGKAATLPELLAAKELDTVTVTGTAVNADTVGETTAADDLSALTYTASTGDVTVTVGTADDHGVNATKIGTVDLSAAAGNIVMIDANSNGTTHSLVNAADSTGITVNLTAKTAISGNDSSNLLEQLVVKNTGGNVTASLGGAAAAYVDYTTATSGTVNLTAANTGGLTSTITNSGTKADGSTSTVTLGNAKTGTTNSVTLAGTVDVMNVNGGTGNDTITLSTGSSDYSGGTFALGAGTDKVDFTAQDGIKTDANGVAINLGSSTLTFSDTGSTTVAAGKAVEYDGSSAAAKAVASGYSFTLSDVESVVGTNSADYIVANAGGSTIAGGDGIDTIVLGAGSDTYVFAATGAGNDNDVIGAFTAGATNGDVMDFNAFLAASATISDKSGGTAGIQAHTYATAATKLTDVALDNNVVMVVASTGTLVDTVGEINAIIGLVGTGTATTDELIDVAASKSGVIIAVDAGDTDAYVYYVANDSTAAVIDSEIVAVGTITLSTAYVDGVFTTDNFVVV